MKSNPILAVVMALVLVVSLAAVGYAQGVGDFCSDNGDFGVDHDTCVVCLNQGRGNFPTCICKFIQDNDLLDDFGFKNLGQCVSFVHSLL